MVNWYRRLNIEFKTVVLSTIITFGLIILMIPLFFISWMEIPLGITLGSLVGIITYLFLGLFNNKNKPIKSMVFTIVVIVIRLLVIAGILFLVGWLYYSKDIKLFNIFAVTGGYFISLAANIILLLGKEKKSDIS